MANPCGFICISASCIHRCVHNQLDTAYWLPTIPASGQDGLHENSPDTRHTNLVPLDDTHCTEHTQNCDNGHRATLFVAEAYYIVHNLCVLLWTVGLAALHLESMQAESPGQQRELIVIINSEGYIHFTNPFHTITLYEEFLAISFYTYSLKICEGITLI